ncbi:hypothetical protein M409DRAFT_29547 [Zasmidium cellare ATCC 36951]|uniref:Transcription factor domain-containing protein n=1 Tax=Zasmidium cellare ATCC 36951 TaxID=1080233 RepID=A0A6A6BYQ9_ZASCE|nr:uncharacterized protein M409DRAFT_29547 [Zasmidium cellare ATCC 36951]KAF2159937.1 hypothetical protein M409DRAFT_29547 [Zasmidium cellare ATCC 36951]
MQTPPDSEPDANYHDPVEDEANSENAAIYPGAGGAVQTVSGRANKTKASVSRRRNVQRNLRTPESFKDEPLVVHNPSSAASRLRLEFTSMMERTHRIGTWMNLLPSRIGHSEAIDAAAKAIVKAVEHANLNTAITQESCLGSYSKAITTLRDDMERQVSSDDLLLTVALLVTFERVFAYSSVPLRSHMHGVVAIMMGQGKSRKPPSEIARALQYQFWAVAFIGPCVMGVPSPFETPRWLQAEPVLLAEDDMRAPWKVVHRLRKMSNQLFIRLPRLILLVKSVSTEANPDRVTEAITLAKDLLEVEDIDAESEILHHVQIQKTDDSDSTSYTMNFSTVPEYEAAAHYWSTHIMLYRLCWRLLGLFPTKTSELKLRPKPLLHAATSRMSANILMAARWGLNKGEVGESCIIMGLVAIWGALNDYDVFASRGITPTRIRMLLKQFGEKVMKPTGDNKLEESGQRLEAAAELFAGGQSSGVLAFTFSRPAAPASNG